MSNHRLKGDVPLQRIRGRAFWMQGDAGNRTQGVRRVVLGIPTEPHRLRNGRDFHDRHSRRLVRDR